MKTKFFRRSLSSRIISFIIIANFIFSIGPVGLYAKSLDAYTLRTPATEGSQVVYQLVGELRGQGQPQGHREIKRIGILTGGGPASGHNAAIYAAIEEARKHGIEIIAIYEGWKGLIDGKLVGKARPLTLEEVGPERGKGGTIIGTSRENPYSQTNIEHEVPQRVLDNIRELKLDALIALGGDDTQGVCHKLQKEYPGFPIIGLSKTMDNDLALPEPDATTYGFITFVEQAIEALLNGKQDALATKRVIVEEIFGRNVGHVAVHAGANVEATMTLIPEQGELDLDWFVKQVIAYYKTHQYGLVVVSEGISINPEYMNNGPILDRAFAEDEVAHAAFKKALRELQEGKKDQFGNPKLADAGRIIAAVLAANGLAGKVSRTEITYNYRSAPTSERDSFICDLLGRAAVRNLIEGNDSGILYVHKDQVKSIPFAENVGGRGFDLTTDWSKELYAKANQALLPESPEGYVVQDQPFLNAQRKKGVPKTKVAINGFGRIGKLVLKAFLENPDNRFEIVAVNDLDTIDNLAHLFRHDSTLGEFKGEVRIEGDNLIIDGRRIKVLSEKDPANLPWKDLGIDIVIEASGRFTKKEDASKHLEAGAKKVVITAPAENEDLTVVLGVNEDKYDPTKHQVISNASCTTNCLAPVVKVLNGVFGIKSGSMLTVHAATNDQNVLDTVHKDQRRARATLGNIIPTSTGAAKAIGKVIPELKGRLDGLAMRVPTSDVSAVYLDVLLKEDTTKEEVNAALKKAAEEGPLSSYLGYTEEALVSNDFLGSPKSGTVDASLTKVINKRRAVVVIWYDNEWGYSNRTVELVNYMLGRAESLKEENALLETAQALNVDTHELSSFIDADRVIYRGTAGEILKDYIENLGDYLQTTPNEQKARALIIAPNFFRIGGAKSALNEIAKLGKNVKIALYGENAQRLKILVGDEDIITGSNLDEVLTELSELGITSGDAVLLRAPEDKIDREINLRQLVVAKNIPITLALAKAAKELLGEASVPKFDEFLKKMAEAEVISQPVYSENRERLLAMLKEGESFAFSEALRVTQKVAAVAAEIEQARKVSEEFMDRV